MSVAPTSDIPGVGGIGFGTLAGIGAASDVASGILNMAETQATNTASSNAQDKQIAFEQMDRATAHQTEVTDLEKAGLNPILSATGGSGAPMAAPSLPN